MTPKSIITLLRRACPHGIGNISEESEMHDVYLDARSTYIDYILRRYDIAHSVTSAIADWAELLTEDMRGEMVSLNDLTLWAALLLAYETEHPREWSMSLDTPDWIDNARAEYARHSAAISSAYYDGLGTGVSIDDLLDATNTLRDQIMDDLMQRAAAKKNVPQN